MIIWNVLTEGTAYKSGKLPPSECSAHYNEYNFTFPALRDEAAKSIKAIFSDTTVPLNVLVTIPDLKIVLKQTGGIPNRLEAEIQSNLP